MRIHGQNVLTTAMSRVIFITLLISFSLTGLSRAETGAGTGSRHLWSSKEEEAGLFDTGWQIRGGILYKNTASFPPS